MHDPRKDASLYAYRDPPDVPVSRTPDGETLVWTPDPRSCSHIDLAGETFRAEAEQLEERLFGQKLGQE